MPTEGAGVFEALGEAGRREILELLADGDRPAGEIAAHLFETRGISQPATSQHLKVLHAAGLVSRRAEGRQRVYGVEPAGFAEARAWLTHFTDTFAQPLDALETELARGRRERRRASPAAGDRGVHGRDDRTA